MRQLGFFLTLFSLLPSVLTVGKASWCYSSQNAACGPSHWNDTCQGQNQSPIDIDRSTVKRNDKLEDFDFLGYDKAPPEKWTLLNNGHAVQMNMENGLSKNINISGGGLTGTYRACQFHFHWGNEEGSGSEHTIDKQQYAMELHIVHLNAKYQTTTEALKDPQGLAVLGFMFKLSIMDNPNYNTIVASLKNISYRGEEMVLASTFRLYSLLPEKSKLSKYYRYQGSLTTPGCGEAVAWSVFEEPIPISQTQFQEFVERIHFSGKGESPQKMRNNFRPTQPLNKRKVYASKDATVSRSPVGTSLSLPVLCLALLVLQFL